MMVASKTLRRVLLRLLECRVPPLSSEVSRGTPYKVATVKQALHQLARRGDVQDHRGRWHLTEQGREAAQRARETASLELEDWTPAQLRAGLLDLPARGMKVEQRVQVTDLAEKLEDNPTEDVMGQARAALRLYGDEQGVAA